MATENPYEENVFTEPQQIAIELIPHFTGTLSILGSLTIVYIILSDRTRKLKNMYHRLLLTCSLIDSVGSTGMTLGSVLAPKGTPGLWRATGNTTTCELSGYLTNLYVCETSVMAFLALYYLFSIRYRVSDDDLRRYLEPTMHATNFLIVIFGFVGIGANQINPIFNGWCYFVDYPRGCSKVDTVECTRGAGYQNFTIFHAVITSFNFISIIVSMTLIYRHIRYIEQASENYTLRSSNRRRSNITETFIQAMSFILAYCITFLGSTINSYCREFYPTTAQNRQFYFPTTILQVFFQPLLGFWNCFIYIRPRYTALRGRNPNVSPFSLLRHIIFYSSTNTTIRRRSLGNQIQIAARRPAIVVRHPTTRSSRRSEIVDHDGEKDEFIFEHHDSCNQNNEEEKEEEEEESDGSTPGRNSELVSSSNNQNVDDIQIEMRSAASACEDQDDDSDRELMSDGIVIVSIELSDSELTDDIEIVSSEEK